MPEQLVRSERLGPVAILTLARPERRNALSLALIRQLHAALLGLQDARVAVLAAEGRVFCSGHDLSEMAGLDQAGYEQIFSECTHLMESIQRLDQPVIAEVQGLATAAGCQLALSCDLVVCSRDAGFATPGVKIGLFCTTPMVALTRAVGRKRAMEMLLTGRMVGAIEAAEWGLVNRVTEAASLRAVTLELAAQVASASRYTVSLGKQAFYAQVDLDQPAAYGFARDTMTRNALAEDAREGISAFLDKREPEWKGR
jgi:enoyl-CoA hydratase/carnithine racemase